jgi:hypothetical protein
MATIKKHVKAIIQLRRAKESEWIEVDPILRVGEPALSTDVYKLKIGNGHDHWSELDYLLESELDTFLENYVTKDYVEEHGGKINSISVNGVVQPIDEDKNVNLDVGIGFSIINCGTSTTVI